MNIMDSIQTALVELSTNKLRTGLTMLGIVIGVGRRDRPNGCRTGRPVGRNQGGQRAG